MDFLAENLAQVLPLPPTPHPHVKSGKCEKIWNLHLQMLNLYTCKVHHVVNRYLAFCDIEGAPSRKSKLHVLMLPWYHFQF